MLVTKNIENYIRNLTRLIRSQMFVTLSDEFTVGNGHFSSL